MTWLVAYKTAMAAWPEKDEVNRLAITFWFDSLAEDGPPVNFEMDEEGRFYRAISDDPGNVVEYVLTEIKGHPVIAILRILD